MRPGPEPQPGRAVPVLLAATSRRALRPHADHGPAGVSFRVWQERGRAWAEQAAAAWLGVGAGDLPAWDRTCEHCGGAHGKPWLPGADLDMSLTRAGDLVLVAGVRSAGRRVRIGVDAELLDVLDGTGRRTFLASAGVLSPAERDDRGRPRIGRARTTDRGLLAPWVRKEALLKALGLGLAVDPSVMTLGGESGSDLLGWDEEVARHPAPSGPVVVGDVDRAEPLIGDRVVAAVAVIGASVVVQRWSPPLPSPTHG